MEAISQPVVKKDHAQKMCGQSVKMLRFRDIEAMFVGKDIATAKALKKDYLAVYADRLVTVNGRVGRPIARRSASTCWKIF